MCLPVNCLKTYTGIAAFLTMALGITGFVFGVIFAFEGDLFIGDLKSPQKITSYSMLGLGVILILIGITGLVGACKKSSCCLGIHNIGIFIFMIVFFAIGITGLVIFKKYEKQISNDLECKNSSNFDKADQFAVEAEKYFCKFGGCACGAKADKLPSNIYNKLNVIVGGPVKIQDCPEYSSKFSKYSEIAVSMAALENTLNCAGICSKSDIYLFTDVNNGAPIDSCGLALNKFLHKYAKRIGLVSMIIFAVLFINIILSCCLCCHPERKKEDIYNRIV